MANDAMKTVLMLGGLGVVVYAAYEYAKKQCATPGGGSGMFAPDGSLCSMLGLTTVARASSPAPSASGSPVVTAPPASAPPVSVPVPPTPAPAPAVPSPTLVSQLIAGAQGNLTFQNGRGNAYQWEWVWENVLHRTPNNNINTVFYPSGVPSNDQINQDPYLISAAQFISQLGLSGLGGLYGEPGVPAYLVYGFPVGVR